jgi:hypothetical protein
MCGVRDLAFNSTNLSTAVFYLPDYLKNSPFIFDPSVKNSSEGRNSSGYRLIPDWQFFFVDAGRARTVQEEVFRIVNIARVKKRLVYHETPLLPEEDFSRRTFKSLNDLIEQNGFGVKSFRNLDNVPFSSERFRKEYSSEFRWV